MSASFSGHDLAAMAHECGATHFSPPPMRAVRGVSLTYEQLEEFSARLSRELMAQNLKRLGFLIAGLKPTGKERASALGGEEGEVGDAEYAVWLPAHLGNEYDNPEAILAGLDRLIADVQTGDLLDSIQSSAATSAGDPHNG